MLGPWSDLLPDSCPAEWVHSRMDQFLSVVSNSALCRIGAPGGHPYGRNPIILMDAIAAAGELLRKEEVWRRSRPASLARRA